MKLQLSIDMIRTSEALEMVEKISDVIDIVEIGTPMIVREGMLPVQKLREKYPQIPILADVKIMDGGEIEATDAFEAGADIVTVLALAEDETIKGVVKSAKRFGKETMADMICVQNIEQRAIELEEMGIDYICIHTAVDAQSSGKSPYNDLALVTPVLKKSKTALAGGVNMQSIPIFKDLKPAIVVVGGALTNQADIRQGVIAMQGALE